MKIDQVTEALLSGQAGENVQVPSFSCLADLLTCHAQTAPEREAIVAPGYAPITYGALWRRVEDAFRGLRSIGIGRSHRVAVALQDGPEAAVTIMSVAACATCIPLNPAFTADEWQRYFRELRVTALVTRPDMDSAGRGVALALGIPVLDPPALPCGGAGPFSMIDVSMPRVGGEGFASSADDAFILLTSGSTSRPKMVPLTHASVCLSAYNVSAALMLDPRDRLLSVLPLFHGHGLISGVLAALAAGSSVVCTSGFDPAAFFRWLTEFRPTWYTAVPAIHQAVLSASEAHKQNAQRSHLRLIRSASSTLPPKVLCELEALFCVPVIDTFGMTEAATQISANPLTKRKLGSVGQAVGVEIAILDGESRRLSPGERGEIALRGPTIARGYDNDLAATRSAFRDGWFRTGDLGYLDPEGYLFIVGRTKEVINRGGQKVAPAEVEQALLGHPDVVEAAVFSVPHRRLGADVAAAVVARAGAKVSPKKLRDFLRERLAPFKVPGPIRLVPEIPKSRGGKINRRELAAAFSMGLPVPGEPDRGEMVPPRSELERRLASVWAELLDLEKIGVDQDFFALGADSLTIAQVLSRLRTAFGVEFSIKDIFDAPTVTALAARVQASKKDLTGAPPSAWEPPTDLACVDADGPQPVSIVQERMLRIEQELPGLPQFNLPFAYRLRGRLNVPALERSLTEVVRRHESLRAGFVWQDERPVALITPAAEIRSSLIVEDLAAPGVAADTQTQALMLRKVKLKAAQECLKPIDMKQPPLFRARLWRLGAEDHVLLLVFHDLIIDGWSVVVFIEELSEIYADFAAARRAQLPQPALRYSDFARWQRQWSTSRSATTQLMYWNERLRKVSPVFAGKPDVKGELTARTAEKHFKLSTDLIAHLTTLSRSQGATLFMTLLAGFNTLVMLRTGRNNICVATMMANRARTGTDRVIGPFANTSLIRTQIDADQSFEEVLNRVRNAVLEAYTMQELPFDILAERLGQEGLDPGSLIQFYFVLQVPFRRPIKLDNVTVRPFGDRRGQSMAMPIDRIWLSVTVGETPWGMTGTCRYKKKLFEEDPVQNWVREYKLILAKAAANPKKLLGRLADVNPIGIEEQFAARLDPGRKAAKCPC